jgi:hypothetical protein
MATRTDAQLTTDANVIKNETAPGANTATRVGNMFVDAIDSKLNIDKIASPTVIGATKLYADLSASNTDGAVSQGGIVAALNSSWLTTGLTYGSNVTTESGNPFQYKKDLGTLKLRGGITITVGTKVSTDVLLTLPVGFRPSKPYKFSIVESVFNETATAAERYRVFIATNGEIKISQASDAIPLNLPATSWSFDLPWME